jgi:hypothetical protein
VTTHWSDAQAKARGAQMMESEPRAAAARYDAASGRIVIDLTNGCTFAFPARRVEELADASDAEIAAVEIAGAGFALHWAARDADLSLGGLMSGVFGTKGWMSELARRAGQSRSPAKAVAARAKGAKLRLPDPRLPHSAAAGR